MRTAVTVRKYSVEWLRLMKSEEAWRETGDHPTMPGYVCMVLDKEPEPTR